ncbi:MAG: tetratricopeptide repeat protein [Pseudomonadota bacterium]
MRMWLYLGLFALLVAGCTAPATRTQPPAPVYERGRRATAEPPGATTAPVEGPRLSVGEPASPAENIPAAETPTGPSTGGSDLRTDAPRERVSPGGTAAGETQLAYARLPEAPAVADNAMGSAARSLMDQADARMRQGDHTGAASYLERAVRIEPRNPALWNRLARVRLAQGNHGLAEELANRSNSYSRGNRGLERSNWGIIAGARRSGGDEAGARAAQAMADGL